MLPRLRSCHSLDDDVVWGVSVYRFFRQICVYGELMGLSLPLLRIATGNGSFADVNEDVVVSARRRRRN